MHRRNLIAYHRSVSNNGSGANPPRRDLSSFRNKTIGFLAFTSLYTAFLYRSGVFYIETFIVAVR
jgi:hypothetical protein